MEEALNKYGSRGRPFYLWAETATKGEDGKLQFPDPALAAGGNLPILVFLKYFDVKGQTLTGVGHVYVKKLDKVQEIALQINKIMGWDLTTQILLYEEIKFSMIEAMKPKQTYQQSEIQDGDIICFQQNLPDLDSSTVTYSDARQYYDYLLNRISVSFYPKPGSDGEAFTLSLSKKMTYEQFSAKASEHLQVDPTHIRFATISSTNNKIKIWIKRGMNHNLQQILQSQFSSYGGYATHRNDALYYEVLETSLADYETKKIMKVVWLTDGISKEVSERLGERWKLSLTAYRSHWRYWSLRTALLETWSMASRKTQHG